MAKSPRRMEDKVKDLLELFDKDIEQKILYEDLKAKFTGTFIDWCSSRGLISKYPIRDKIYYMIESEGLSLLNTIRMNHSIKAFDNSSKFLSIIMIGLTIALLLFTVVLAWKEIVPLLL